MLDPPNTRATRMFTAAVISPHCPKLETTSCPSKGRRVSCDISCPWNTTQPEKEPDLTALDTIHLAHRTLKKPGMEKSMLCDSTYIKNKDRPKGPIAPDVMELTKGDF